MTEYIYRYKYLPFDPDGALKVITQSTIKFSNPADFNDPFDCVPFIDSEDISPHNMRDLLKKVEPNPSRRLQNRGKYEANLRRDIESGTFTKKFNNGIGICCLSRTGLSPLMWAHYANEHHGFLVEFEIPFQGQAQDHPDVIDHHDGYLVPFQVIYSKGRPKQDLFPETTKANVDITWLTKSKDWEYEQEERVLSYQKGPGIHHIAPELLCSVVAGMRMNDENFAQLQKAVKQHNQKHGKNVKLYRAEADRREYKIHVPDHPRLGSAQTPPADAKR